MDELPSAEKVWFAALGRASAALVVPLLTSYERIRSENPTVEIPALDRLVDDSDSLEQFQMFRNSIFHVQAPTSDAERLDSALMYDNNPDDMLETLYDGCAEFLSWFTPTIPRT